jgi:hypothetical protein
MGQNKKYGNDGNSEIYKAGQAVGQFVGQRDSIKSKALSRLAPTGSLSQGGGTGSIPGKSENSSSVPSVPHTGGWDSGTKFNALLRDVGGKAFLEDGKPVLRFEPPLKSESEDPERWAKAKELEGLFWRLCEERGY